MAVNEDRAVSFVVLCLCDLCTMPSDKKSACSSSGAQNLNESGAADINSLIIAKLDSLSSDIAAVRKEQNTLLTDLKHFKTDFKKLSAKLEKELKVCKNQITVLIKENESLKGQIIDLNREVLQCSQNSFQNFVKIDNIPLNENEDLFDILQRIAKVIDIEMRIDMVDYIYRRKFGRQNPPSVIIKFLYSSVKNRFIVNSRKNKEKINTEMGHQIFVNELLTPFTYKLFKQVRELKGQGLLDSVWHKNGIILVKRNINDKPKVIRCKEDLLFLRPPGKSGIPGYTSDENDQEISESDASLQSTGSKRKRAPRVLQPAGSIANFLVKNPK
uniref:DUF4806 domain-containing protein n=1 Tax=Rhodnius prolixus TaxID=13249 RepID=T1I4A3_RHOPR